MLPPLPDGAGEACRLYCSVPGPLQTVQRAEIWGVLVALQGCIRVHVGVDNLNVVRHVSRIIDGRCSSKPFSLVNDGDLLLRIQQLVCWREIAIAAVSKVKGHADEVSSFLMRLQVQGLAVVGGDVYHSLSMVSLLGKGLGNCPWVVALSRVSRSVLYWWLVASCCGACVTMWTHIVNVSVENNNNNTIWRGSVLTGEELHPTLGS